MKGRGRMCEMEKDVMIVTGAGQISMAIARRMGHGKNHHG